MYYFSYLYLLIFLSLTILTYFLFPIQKRWYVLLAASLIFYLYNAKMLCIFIFFTTLSIYFAAIWLEKIQDGATLAAKYLPKDELAAHRSRVLWQKKAVVVILLIFNFGILALLKYSGFMAATLNVLNPRFRLPSLPMILPLGISFYTLQAVSYVIDTYRGQVKANRNFGQVLLFCIFFPQIVEGPIGRYGQLSPQLYEGHRFDYRNLTQGIQLICWGVFKEFVIADRAAILADRVFEHPASYSGSAVVLAVLIYTLQLYADFSGCIDVAAGSAQLFGITLAPNFQRPFFSRSVNEFWRRWHITLGAWLRDYIFYSVSLSKPLIQLSRFARQKLNSHLGKWVTAGSAMFFVWAAMGIWHGAGWKYLFYGMYYYLIMMAGMLFEPLFRKFTGLIHLNREAMPYRLFQILRTFVLVNIGMLIFRADTMKQAFTLFRSMFSQFNGSLFDLGLDWKELLILAISALLLLIVGLIQEKGISIRSEIEKIPLPVRWVLYAAGIYTIILFGAYGVGYAPAKLIYAGF